MEIVEPILEGIGYIIEAFGKMLGLSTRKKHRMPAKPYHYQGFRADRAALAQDKRRAFNRKFKDSLPF